MTVVPPPAQGTEPIADPHRAMPSGQGPTTGFPPINWFWCPNCFIASEKSGPCPSCRQLLVPASAEGLPYGPYRPKTLTRRSRSSLIMSLLGLGVFVLLLGMGFWLYQAGAPQVAPPATSDGLINSAKDTAVHLPELGTVNLPGVWAPDGAVLSNLQTSLTANGGKAQVLLATRSGEVTLWMASITKSPGGSGGAAACTTTPISNGSPTIAGHQAERDDSKVVCTGDTEYVSQYRLTDPTDSSATLFIKFVSPNPKAPFDRFADALLTLPGSQAGGIAL